MRLVALGVIFGAIAAAQKPPTLNAAPTFYKDVLPILQNHCQECHRPGEIAPMALMSYEQTRPWAKSIKANTLEGKMPPWPADPHFGKFANDRSLTRAELDILAAWADTGAAEGRPTDAPMPRKWVEGWNIPKPDVVLRMPEAVNIPAKGTIEYQYIIVPSGFTEDKWIQAIEVRPSNRAVVHHAVVFLREPGSRWLAGAKPGVAFVPAVSSPQERMVNTGGGGSDILTTYTPGMVPDEWQPGQARLVKAGSDLVFQIHYTANGTAGTDQTSIGLVFAKEPPKEKIVSMSAANRMFKIPAGDGNYSAEANFTVRTPMNLVSLFPHLHLRGKAFQYDVIYPDGHSETILKVDKWSLNWQLSYTLAEPLSLPVGTRIKATAWWDNSANNPANPDPTAEVMWGEQSWEEMLVGFMNVAVDPKTAIRSFQR
jgi:hypothetical protein